MASETAATSPVECSDMFPTPAEFSAMPHLRQPLTGALRTVLRDSVQVRPESRSQEPHRASTFGLPTPLPRRPRNVTEMSESVPNERGRPGLP